MNERRYFSSRADRSKPDIPVAKPLTPRYPHICGNEPRNIVRLGLPIVHPSLGIGTKFVSRTKRFHIFKMLFPNEDLTSTKFHSAGEDRLIQKDAWKDLNSELQSQAMTTIESLNQEWLQSRRELSRDDLGGRSEIICSNFATRPMVTSICQDFDSALRILSDSHATRGWQLTGFVNAEMFAHGWAAIVFKADEYQPACINAARISYMFNLDSNPGLSARPPVIAPPRHPSVPALSVTAPASVGCVGCDDFNSDLLGIGAQTPTQEHFPIDLYDQTLMAPTAAAHQGDFGMFYPYDETFDPSMMRLPPSGPPSVISNYSRGSDPERFGVGSAGSQGFPSGVSLFHSPFVQSERAPSDSGLSAIADLFLSN